MAEIGINAPIPTIANAIYNATRMASQAAALQDGVVTIEEVEPPPEVVR